MKRVLLAGCLGRAAAAACSCKAAWSNGYCSDQAGCPTTACDGVLIWCEVEPDGCDGSSISGGIYWMECDQSTPVGSHAPTASPAPTVAPSTVAPSASPAPTVDVPAMTDWGPDDGRWCFSTLDYYIGEAPTLAACWATCYATFGVELVAVDMDTDNYCYCQNDCLCMQGGWDPYHTATLASLSALPGACDCSWSCGEGDGCHCLECADAIDGGVCYPGMIGKLHPVTQLSNGTIVEVITTICPDVDPDALCADGASQAQFIAPGALAAALLLSL